MATSTVYSGALKPKKKYELQEIATNLNISASGTKDDLEQRIREYLDANEHKLIDDPTYTGLYGRKKRQTTAQPVAGSEDESSPPASRANIRKPSRGVVALRSKEAQLATVEPTHLPLPPSPIRSIINEVREAIEEPAIEVSQKTDELLHGSEIFLENLRTFISNSTNIATITVVSELLFIVYTIVPWSYLNIPLIPHLKTTSPGAWHLIAHVPYPPANFILSSYPYTTIALWAIPTLLIPQLFGALISFSNPRRKIDPLSASIVRVACAVAGGWGVGPHVIGWKWRVLSASIAAAFALSEAVESAGQSRT